MLIIETHPERKNDDKKLQNQFSKKADGYCEKCFHPCKLLEKSDPLITQTAAGY